MSDLKRPSPDLFSGLGEKTKVSNLRQNNQRRTAQSNPARSCEHDSMSRDTCSREGWCPFAAVCHEGRQLNGVHRAISGGGK